MKLRVPVVTLCAVGAAMLVAQFPSVSACLAYDRQAILAGEVWRMFTGHWVHFSASHLVYDCLAMGIAGWIIETQRLRHFGWLCLLAPWLISGLMLVAEPQMRWFGGLSALATMAVVYLALCGLHERAPWRWICLATLAGVAGKIVFEMATGAMLFASMPGVDIKVSSASHLAGVAVAGMFYGWNRIQENGGFAIAQWKRR